jgi:hypothetical protein
MDLGNAVCCVAAARAVSMCWRSRKRLATSRATLTAVVVWLAVSTGCQKSGHVLSTFNHLSFQLMAIRLITLSDARVAGIGIGASVVSDAGLLLTALGVAGLIGGIACKLMALGVASLVSGMASKLTALGVASLIGGVACKLMALGVASLIGGMASKLIALCVAGVGRTSPAASMAGIAGLLVALRPAGVFRADGAAVGLWA